jgi:hypothetical protein
MELKTLKNGGAETQTGALEGLYTSGHRFNHCVEEHEPDSGSVLK